MALKGIGIDMDGGDATVEGGATIRLVYGVERFLKERRDVNVVLYGNEREIRDAFGGRFPDGVEVVGSVDNGSRGKGRVDGTSLGYLFRDAEQGKIEGIYTAGDTSQVARKSTSIRVKGLGMPTLVADFPSTCGKFVVSDVGFTDGSSKEKYYSKAVDKWAKTMFNQGLVASVYARSLCGKDRLTWGTLSIGIEEHKGSDADKALDELVRERIKGDLGYLVNYVGKVEPRVCLEGKADVVLANGYIGNLVLKMGEASVGLIGRKIKDRAYSLPLWRQFILKYVAGGSIKMIRDGVLSELGIESGSSALGLGYKAVLVKDHGEFSCESAYHSISRLARCDDSLLGDKLLDSVGKFIIE
ncbi:MAG: hypothetical protein KJ592_03475 [Nanoarchaeota archaeon]|nr:hypothetical protein [Nanoarchaeota archaeon]